MGIPVPTCINCGHRPCLDFPLDIETSPEDLALEQGPGGYYDGYCLAEPRRWTARSHTTGECECGASGNLYNVEGQRGDIGPEQVCETCARTWVGEVRRSHAGS